MAIAYSGFLFSDIPLLNQLGFFIVFAVLIDTFGACVARGPRARAPRAGGGPCGRPPPPPLARAG